MLDRNQEAPPRGTNAGSAHRITSLSLFFFCSFSTFSISDSSSTTYTLFSLVCLVTSSLCYMSFLFLSLQFIFSLICFFLVIYTYLHLFPPLSAFVISVFENLHTVARSTYSSSWCLFSHQYTREMKVLV